jgi:hypothetical protein
MTNSVELATRDVAYSQGAAESWTLSLPALDLTKGENAKGSIASGGRALNVALVISKRGA